MANNSDEATFYNGYNSHSSSFYTGASTAGRGPQPVTGQSSPFYTGVSTAGRGPQPVTGQSSPFYTGASTAGRGPQPVTSQSSSFYTGASTAGRGPQPVTSQSSSFYTGASTAGRGPQPVTGQSSPFYTGASTAGRGPQPVTSQSSSFTTGASTAGRGPQPVTGQSSPFYTGASTAGRGPQPVTGQSSPFYTGASTAGSRSQPVTGQSSSFYTGASTAGRGPQPVTGQSSPFYTGASTAGRGPQPVTSQSSSFTTGASTTGRGPQPVTGQSSSFTTGASTAGSRSQPVTSQSSSFNSQQPPVSSNICTSKTHSVPGAEGGLTSHDRVTASLGHTDVGKWRAGPHPQGYSGPTAHYGERQYDTKLGIKVRIYSGDISKSEADAITTSEGCEVKQKSQVTKSISYSLGRSFEERRENLFKRGSLQEGMVLETRISKNESVKYHYVLHAVIKSATKIDMTEVYCRVFEKSDELHVNTVAVPLLGAGRGQVKAEPAVRHLARGLHRYATNSPKRYTKPLNVEIVTMAVEFVDMIFKEIEKTFNSPTESASALQSGTSMSKTMSEKHPQSPAEDTSDSGRKTLGADGHQHPGQSNTHSTAPQRRSNRPTTVRDGVMVAASKSEKASTGAFRTHYESKVANLEAGTAGLSIGGADPGRTACGHHSATDAENTSHLGWSEQCNQFDEDDLDETNTECPEMQAEPKGTDPSSSEVETCPICMDVIQNVKVLDKCGHKFCKECIEDSFRSYKPVCPSCLTVYDIITGNMPHGTMRVHRVPYLSLPGYEGSGIIQIEYHFPNGIQTKAHPHPGRGYHGTSRVAFLPNNQEGEKVYKLLKLAFDRKLTFTVGRSATTGRDDVVTWNDIHHKTSIDGGPTSFGYPDETYLYRVQEELASKGVTVDQL